MKKKIRKKIEFQTPSIIVYQDTPEVMRNENMLFVDTSKKKKIKPVLDWI